MATRTIRELAKAGISHENADDLSMKDWQELLRAENMASKHLAAMHEMLDTISLDKDGRIIGLDETKLNKIKVTSTIGIEFRAWLINFKELQDV